MSCGNACVCIRRCDLWKRRLVNKHHQQSCCGRKRVCTYVVGGQVGMNDTCNFTFDLKNLTPPHPNPPQFSVASKMCSCARIRHHLRSIKDVFMCKERQHLRSIKDVFMCKESHQPHPTPPQPNPPQFSVASKMCSRARIRHHLRSIKDVFTRKERHHLRSIKDVFMCKESHQPHPTPPQPNPPQFSVASKMCSRARIRHHLRSIKDAFTCKECQHLRSIKDVFMCKERQQPHPTPPQPTPVLRSIKDVFTCKERHHLRSIKDVFMCKERHQPHPTPPHPIVTTGERV